MKVSLYTKTGTKSTKKITLDDSVFSGRVNEKLLSQAVFVYLSNQRQANAHTKTRGDVRGGGKKPWRQKGTGRARHGSTRSPIWTGGGVVFGPTNSRNFKKGFSKKMRIAGIRAAFSKKMNMNEIFAIEKIQPKKTKEIDLIINKLNIKGKVTFIQLKEESLYRTTKNLPNVCVRLLDDISIYDILYSGALYLNEDVIEEISKRWGDSEKRKIIKKSPKREVLKKKASSAKRKSKASSSKIIKKEEKIKK